MFKKIFEKLKKAAAWVADKVKKAIDLVRNHKEVVVAATVGGLACVAAVGFVSMTHDPNMYPDISTKASVADDKIMVINKTPPIETSTVEQEDNDG